MKRVYCLSLSLLSVFLGFEAVVANERPNIVFILSDDMGWADVGAYDAKSKIPTPALDQLAAEGMLFRDAHSTGSTCIPARFGLLTGSHPSRQPSMSDKSPLIPESMPTLASHLRSAGYETAMVGKWHLGFVDKLEPNEGKPLEGGPVDRGFDSFFGIHASTDIQPYYYIDGKLPTGMPLLEIAANNDSEEETGWNRIQGAFWRAGGIGQDLKLEEVTPLFFDKAVDYVAEKHEKPFFLYLALPSPHTPWLPTEEFVGKSGVGSYGDFVMTVDHGVGRVMKQLEESGLSGNTLVFFSSDNGPVWYDKDEDKFDHSSVGALRGMKGDNWEGGHRVPFLVRYPWKVKAGTESTALISFLDVTATLAELVGSKETVSEDSISFLPVLLGESEASDRLSLVHGRNKKYSYRFENWKLLLHQGSAGFSKYVPTAEDPEGQLYDLSSDLGEEKNLWNLKPELVDKLTKQFEEELESLKGPKN